MNNPPDKPIDIADRLNNEKKRRQYGIENAEPTTPPHLPDSYLEVQGGKNDLVTFRG